MAFIFGFWLLSYKSIVIFDSLFVRFFIGFLSFLLQCLFIILKNCTRFELSSMLDMYYDLIFKIVRPEKSFVGTKASDSQSLVLVSPVFQIKIGGRFYCTLHNTFEYDY